MDLQNEFPKKTLFWKYMIVALQAMERFYQATATGYQPDEKYARVQELVL